MTIRRPFPRTHVAAYLGLCALSLFLGGLWCWETPSQDAAVTCEPSDGSQVSLADFLPTEYTVGNEVLGLRILSVQGDEIELENPFVYHQLEMVSADGFPAGGLCPGTTPTEYPLTFKLGGGTPTEVAHALQDAFFAAALEARTGWEIGPYVGYCSAYDTPAWYQTPGDIVELENIQATYCDPEEEGYVECEEAKCEWRAVLDRAFAQRREQRRLNNDLFHKYNVGMFLLYSKIIQTCQSADDAMTIDWYQSHMLRAYQTVAGADPEMIAQQMGTPERDLQICLAGITPGHGNPEPGWPNCSFDFGLGPVGISIGTDGSITLSGGAGLIVGITHNLKTNVTHVNLSAGLEGHLGPFSISAEAGASVDLQGGIEAFGDVSLGVGPLKCSF